MSRRSGSGALATAAQVGKGASKGFAAFDAHGRSYRPDGTAVADSYGVMLAPWPSGGDDTAAVVAAIEAARVAGVGLPVGKYIRLVWPNLDYSTSGFYWAPNVWFDFGPATRFVKNADGTTVQTNSMVRTVDTAVPLSGADAFTLTFAAPLTAGLTGANLAAPWAGSKQYAPPVILPNGDVIQVMLTPGSIVTTFNVATSANPGLTDTGVGATYYGPWDNMKITNGIFFTNDKTCPAQILRLANVRWLVMDGVTVQHSDGCASWSAQIGGHDIEVNNFKVLGGKVRFQDGPHLTNGYRISVNGGFFQTGDDAIAFGTDANLGIDDEGLRHVTVNGIRVDAALGSIKAYFGIPPGGFFGTSRGTVDGVTIDGPTGRLGKVANGVLYCIDTSPAPALGRVSNVHVRGADITVGSSDTTGDFVNTGTSPYAIKMNYATNCSIGGTVRVTDTTGAYARYRLGQIANSVNCGVDRLVCPAVPANGGIEFTNNDAAQVSNGGYVTRSDLTGGGTHLIIFGGATGGVGVPGLTVEHCRLRGLAAASYGAFCSGGTGSTLRFDKNTVTEAAAGNGRAVLANSNNCLAYLWMRDNDLTGLQTAMLGSFNTSTGSYEISGNRGWTTRSKGVATILNGQTSVIVALAGAPALRLIDNSLNSLAQVHIDPCSSFGTAVRFWKSVGADDQHFVINIDQVAGQNVSFNYDIDTGRKPL